MKNKSLNLGIDCDGILYPFTELFIKYVHKITGIKYSIPSQFKMYEEWGMNYNDWVDLFNKFVLSGGFEIKTAYKNSSYTLKKLHQLGHKVHIITHRFFPDSSTKIKKKSINSTINWVEDNDIYCDSLIFIKEKNLIDVDILVDDAIHNLENLHAETIPICINRAWNGDWNKKMFLKKSKQINLKIKNIIELIPIVKQISILREK